MEACLDLSFNPLEEGINKKEFITKIFHLKHKIKNLAINIFGDEEWSKWYQKEIFNFGEKIRKSPYDYTDYLAWHILIESGIKEKMTYWDLPNPYSIEFFLEDSIRKLELLSKNSIEVQQKITQKKIKEIIDEKTLEEKKKIDLEKKIMILNNQLTDLFKEIFGENWKNHFLEEIFSFIELLKENGINPEEYEIWNLVFENSGKNKETKKFDILEPYSIELFLKKAINKLKKLKKTIQDISKEQIEKKIILEEIKEIKQLKKKMHILGDILYGEDSCIFIHEKIIEFVEKIKKNDFDVYECYAYHVLIDSTTDKNKTPKLDFKEPCSVKLFLEEQINLLELELKIKNDSICI